MPGIEEAVNYQDVWDYGARGDGNSNDAKAINAAIAAAVSRNVNGGRVLIRPTTNFYNLETPIVLLDDVEILIVGGAQLKVAYGLDIDAIFGTGVSRCRIHGNGIIMGTYDFTKTYHGIHLVSSYLCSIEGVHIAGMARSGIFVDGGSDNRIRNVASVSNGRSGMHLANATARNHLDSPICYNNGQGSSGGDGIRLDGASVHNTITNPACFDAVGPYPTLQQYPIRESAASGCDFNLIVGLQATGNVTSNNPSLIGANSKWTDVAQTNGALTTPTLTSPIVIGRITANTAGASAKPLLNPVPSVLVAGNYPHTAVSGTGDKVATALTLVGVPASATMVSLLILYIQTSSYAVGDGLTVYHDTGTVQPSAIAVPSAQLSIAAVNVTMPCAPGASNQVAYSVTCSGNWSADIYLLSYSEPA